MVRLSLMQNARRPTEVPPPTEVKPSNGAAPVSVVPERLATQWVSRATAIVGMLVLLAALVNWAARPGHYRITLALLVVAMFCAILHSYTFENGD